jgi:hypothetical protein
MAADSFSAYHGYVATSLARDMNAYVQHSTRILERATERDHRGNPPVITTAEKTMTYELRIKVTILAAVYVEALANLFLAFKLNGDQLAAIDRTEILQKWATLPTLFLPEYKFPKSETLYADLKLLIAHRNSIAHMKPQISSGSTVLHEGNLPTQINIHQQIQRWDSLPENLITHLGKFDTSLAFQKYRVASSIDEYAEIRAGHPFPATPRKNRSSRQSGNLP